MQVFEPGSLRRCLPFLDLSEASLGDLVRDAQAALVVTFMAVPQGVAYAVIAGLPPAMGLYASAFPAIVGALMRSSRHVITGPTNALSLLVGGGVALMAGADPLQVGIALALMVGVFQVVAGMLRLGALVDYISDPVVLGYITGAGLLIGVGQLPNVTGTASGGGHVLEKLWFWLEGLGQTSILAVAMAASTAALIVLLRRVSLWIPGALIAMSAATALSIAFDLGDVGMLLISDLAPVPAGLPPLTLPDIGLFAQLMPLAVACTVLSLVESSAVARSIASRSGQRLDTSAEFAGQGLANLVAGMSGGYPTSGSLARSALNERGGARTRMGGVFAGLLMLLVLLVLGHVVNHTPIASLAGLLVVVALDLVDLKRIKETLASRWADRVAFAATLLGTWVLPLDKAIYLGVGISLVLFLRRARLLTARELLIDREGRLKEAHPEDKPSEQRRCRAVRILHLEGRLFFGVEGELQAALDRFIRQPQMKVLVLRLKRTQGMDATIAASLAATAQRMEAQGRHLILAGVRAETMDILRRTGAVEAIGAERIFTNQRRWFASMNQAIDSACDLALDGETCSGCPLARGDGLVSFSVNS